MEGTDKACFECEERLNQVSALRTFCMTVTKTERPVFTYSLNLRIALDVSVILFIVIANLYYHFVWNYAVGPYPFIVVGLGVYDFYRNWRMPLRKIRFFDSHFEVSGWRVDRKASYDELEDLSRVRRVIGDFRSGSAVWFSIKGDPNEFMVPNRKVGKPKVELYSWLRQKNPKVAETS